MKFILQKKYIKYLTAAMFALLIGAGLLIGAPLSLFSQTASADETNVAQVGDASYTDFGEALSAWTNDSSALKLLQDVTISNTIEIGSGETKTLDLSTHTLTFQSEEGGSVLKVSGKLTVKGSGTLAGGNAQQGGGIYVDVLGDLTLDGCTVSGNTAPQGGGVFVTGKLTLAGDTVVESNTDGNGGDSNIFLSSGNKIRLNGFTGRAGVTVVSFEEPFAEEVTGEFFSDDKGYTVEGNALKVAPLKSISAEFDSKGKKVFPTTSLETTLKEYIRVTGTNVNDAPYVGNITFTLSGTLEVGSCEITVSARGEASEEVDPVTLTLEVDAPSLVGIEVVPPETLPEIYFDSPLSALADGGYIFRGVYDDDVSRKLAPKTGEEEGDFYTLSGNFAERTDGKATITVSVGDISAEFQVEVSKYALRIADEQVKEGTVLQGGSFDVRSFVPGLPAGVAVVALVNGEPCNSEALSPDVYPVVIYFEVTDRENYEEIEGYYETHLTVLRKTLTRELDGSSVSVSKASGLLPSWALKAEDVSDSVPVRMEGSLEAMRVYELTLEESGVAVESSGAVRVRLPIAEELREKELKLYLLNADGSLTELSASREEDGLVFDAASLTHARFVLAAETASQTYLILSIVFGMACALGAAAVLGYLVFKRKRETH